MRLPTAIAALVSLCAFGCQQQWVQKHSNLLSSTVPELYYGQVLDNLALLYAAGYPSIFWSASAGDDHEYSAASSRLYPNLGFCNDLCCLCALDFRSPIRRVFRKQSRLAKLPSHASSGPRQTCALALRFLESHRAVSLRGAHW